MADWKTESDEDDWKTESDTEPPVIAGETPPSDEFGGCSILTPTQAVFNLMTLASAPPETTHAFVMRPAKDGSAENDLHIKVTRRGTPVDEELHRLRAENAAARDALPTEAAAGVSRCGICENTPANTAATACGHVYACFVCAASLTACPLCRKDTTFLSLRFS